jgi:hypothetical protein
MRIPDASQEKLLEAIGRFDQELRDTPDFAGWEDKLSYRYAIEHKGRRYPVKTIISLATGLPTSGFSGGSEANGYVRARGLTVVTLRGTVLRESFEAILRDYPTARATQPFSHDNEVRRLFETCERVLSSPEVLGDKNVRVKASIGQGNWAKVPWIAFLDPRQTDTTQRGVYVVLLFRQDGSGVYATLNQGVTAPQSELGPAAGLEQLRERARTIRARPETRDLERLGFQTDDAIDLRADPGLGRDYEASTIAYKLYEKGAVPDDELITADLQALLTAYDTYVTAQTPTVHLVLKWSPEHARDTIERHKRVADARGSVWWGKFGTSGIGRDRLKQVRDQLAGNVETFVFLSGGDTLWRTRMEQITDAREEVDDALLPGYYRKEDCSFFVRLSAFEALERQWFEQNAVLDSNPVPGSGRGALQSQANPAYVRLSAGTPPTPASARALCLIGTWRNVEANIERVNQAITERKAWASPWSFPVKREAQPALQKPFFVYLYAGEGRVPARMRVSDYVTSHGNEGRQSPWPDITDAEWVGKTRSGPEQADIFKTWFKVEAIERLTPELRISDFEPAQGLSVEGSLLSAVTFGYAYRRLEDPMEALVSYTLLERGFLEQLVSALTRPMEAGGSPQIVLAGPPGTSKTWVAEAIARHITGDANRVRLVQFHPNYSYEAFVEGLRPVAEGGGITFKQQHGALLRLVEDMRAAGEANAVSPLYALVVDEMNRANLPRVFGELMYLFEYRDKTIRLQYSEAFSLPANLRFIGTMNTADRSIRSIDIALRRRFDVFELKPDSGVLSRYF